MKSNLYQLFEEFLLNIFFISCLPEYSLKAKGKIA